MRKKAGSCNEGDIRALLYNSKLLLVNRGLCIEALTYSLATICLLVCLSDNIFVFILYACPTVYTCVYLPVLCEGIGPNLSKKRRYTCDSGLAIYPSNLFLDLTCKFYILSLYSIMHC